MTAPDPMTPAEADLQDFPFMPLHVARLRDSNLAAEEHPEACWYAVLLWSASWHQLPAGSLPDNEAVLCRLLGLGRDIKTFRKHRAGAMRGWITCSDGRLYHAIVAEQVVAAWDSKLRQRHRTFCATVRKHNERNAESKVDSPTFETWTELGGHTILSDHVTAMSRVTPSELERDIGSKGQGQGQGQGQGDSNTDANASLSDKRASRISPAWVPSHLPKTVASLAAQWPPDRLDRELDAFRDYWTSRSKDAAKLDWDKTWHNRIRDQHDKIMRENRNGNRNFGPPDDGLGPNARAAIKVFRAPRGSPRTGDD